MKPILVRCDVGSKLADCLKETGHFLTVASVKCVTPLYRPYNPTVPTWSPALCRTCDRFEFWICFNFQTWFQSWSSWSHFFLFLHFFEFLKIYFSWRLLQLIFLWFFMVFLGFCTILVYFSDLKCTKKCLGVVLSVILPPRCLLWYRALIFLFYGRNLTAPKRTDQRWRATEISNYWISYPVDNEHLVQK